MTVNQPQLSPQENTEAETQMAEGITGIVWAFWWGLAAASGVFAGLILGLTTRLRTEP